MGLLMDRLKKVLGLRRSAGRAEWSSSDLGISGKVAGFEEAGGQKTLSLVLYDFESDVEYKFVRMDLDIAATTLRVFAAGDKFIRAAREARKRDLVEIEASESLKPRYQ